FIVVKVHRICSTPLRVRTQRCCIAEHFRERNKCIDDLCRTTRFQAFHASTARCYSTHDISHILLCTDGFNLHHQFKQNGIACVLSCSKCHGSGNFKRHFV